LGSNCRSSRDYCTGRWTWTTTRLKR
jgi:hypothetical protein